MNPHLVNEKSDVRNRIQYGILYYDFMISIFEQRKGLFIYFEQRVMNE